MKTNIRTYVSTSLAAIAFLFGGCATERVMTTGAQFPATDPGSIKIYQASQPPAAYDEIGRVSVDKYNNFAIARTGDELNALLRSKAAAIGGDAIVSVTEDFASISGVVVKFRAAPSK